MGIEAPIALGMLGLVLVHVAGRASNSVVVLGDATHLVVFFGGLVMLGGIGLLGRNDLGHRIPNALEGVIYLAALDRVLCVVIGGEVPIPFGIDPFVATLSTLTWTVPFVIIEALLLAAVFGFDWVEGKRIQHDLSDHRGAGGRSAWILFVALLSFGPAAFAVIMLSARRGVWWTQPAVVLAAWLMTPMAYLASSAWLSDIIALPSLSFIASCLGLPYHPFRSMGRTTTARSLAPCSIMGNAHSLDWFSIRACSSLVRGAIHPVSLDCFMGQWRSHAT